jgi:signal transduction histidine kinase
VLLLLLVAAVSPAWAVPPPDDPLVVGAATDHYPYSYLDANNKLTGFAVDLFDEVARVGGLKIRRVTGTSADLNRRFFAGEFPVAQVYAYSPGGQGSTGFSAPYLTLKGALFVRSNGVRIDSLSDLAGRSVIVGRGSSGEEFLRHSGLAITLVPVETADASLDLLARGHYDAALTSRLTGMAIVSRSGYRNVLPTGPPIDDLTVSLCFASHDVDRLVQINEGLAILYRTGDYERIYRRWFARYEPTSFTPQELAHYVAGVFFVVAMGAVWMSWHQRRLSTRVAQQARELRAMDGELAQGRRLRAVGEMVGGIAHEFNNLLTPIVLKVELLREEREADPGLQRELEVIAGAADRAATLTRRLLTFGRQWEHEPSHVHLSEIVAANVDLVLPTCDPRIAVVVDVPPQLPAILQNPSDLHQVVLNLLMNARDTLHEKLERDAGAKATVTVTVEALASTNGRGVAGIQRLSVTDTGAGMPREVLERVFEPFFTTKEVGRGTGLGLATVWHLVQTCGGRVEVDSTPGIGTTFRVELPRQSRPSHPPDRA